MNGNRLRRTGAIVVEQGVDGFLTAFFKRNVVDGGVGTDTLKLAGSIDLETADFGRLKNIERIDLGSGDHHVVSLNAQDVLDMTGNDKTLMILGDAADRVSLGKTAGGQEFAESGWQHTETIGGVSHTFDVYTSTLDTNLRLLVENKIVIE